jgi:GNAT superfamily N-acetyltransferase
MSFVIRTLIPSDFEAWQPLWQGYLVFYKSDLSREQTALTWSRLHDPAAPIHAFGAFDGTQMIGFTIYLFHLSSWAKTSYCYLEDLFTSEAARGKGVAAGLIDAVADDARARGAGKIYWQTNEDNVRARALYDRVASHDGFIIYARPLV